MSKLEITLSPDVAPLVAKLRPEQLNRAVMRGMTAATQLIHGHISRERLVGKGPFPVAEHRLGEVTQMLRKTLRWTKAEVVGDKIVSSIGSNLSYAGIHEFGFSGSVTVKAHVRHVFHEQTDGGRKPISAALTSQLVSKRRKRAQAITGQASTVKAHTRQMNMPERAPIRTGAAEHADEFSTAILAEVMKELAP